MSPEERVLKTEDAFGGLRPEQATRLAEIRERASWNEEGLETVSSGYWAASSAEQTNEDIAYLLERVEKLEAVLELLKDARRIGLVTIDDDTELPDGHFVNVTAKELRAAIEAAQ